MCGFLSIYAPAGDTDQSELERGLAVVRYRGPDSQNSWVSADRRVALGHARLAIIDLATGDQPIYSEDESIIAIVNGEFYGFEEIRERLQSSGHRFRTRSDSEILVHLYEECGTRCLEHLRGEFAFVLWDCRKRRIFAARDRVGTKPLYYARHGQRLYFSSEIKSLLELGVPARWNKTAVFDAAARRPMYNLSTEMGVDTLFDGVSQIPPAHFVFASPEQPVLATPYWDFDYLSREEDARSALTLAEATAMVSEELVKAVKLRLRADVDVGCYLSAGVDSAGILAIAASVSSHPIPAFTMTFADATYDEGRKAKEIAEALNCPYVPIEVSYAKMADVYEDSIWHSENYMWNTNVMAKYLLSRSVRDAGYKVVLSGQGADEVFAGYGYLRNHLARKNPGSSARARNHTISSSGKAHGARGALPAFLRGSIGAAALTASVLDEGFKQQFHGRDVNRIWLSSNSAREKQWPGVSRAMYLWNKSALPDYLLSCVGDRPEMANSVESRIPFLDHHLIEILGRIPVRHKINQQVEKIVLRDTLDGKLPHSARTRKKRAFFAPPASLDPTSMLYQCVRDTLSGPLPTFLDRRKVGEFVDTLPKVEPGRLPHPGGDAYRRFMAADRSLMFLSSLTTLGRQFSLVN